MIERAPVIQRAKGADAGSLVQAAAGRLVLNDTVLDSVDGGSGLFVAPGAAAVLSGRTTLRGTAGDYRGARVAAHGTLDLTDQSEITGYAVGLPGAGILNEGTVRLAGHARVDGNTSSGADGLGGGVYNAGTLTVASGAQIRDNAALAAAVPDQAGPDGRSGQSDGVGGADGADLAGGAGRAGGGIYNVGTASVAPGSVTANRPGQWAGTSAVEGCAAP